MIDWNAGPLRSGKPWAAARKLRESAEIITSKTGGGLMVIGVDYGAKSSFAAVVERRADGSFYVVEVIEGKGLDNLDDGTSHEQESDDSV